MQSLSRLFHHHLLSQLVVFLFNRLCLLGIRTATCPPTTNDVQHILLGPGDQQSSSADQQISAAVQLCTNKALQQSNTALSALLGLAHAPRGVDCRGGLKEEWTRCGLKGEWTSAGASSALGQRNAWTERSTNHHPWFPSTATKLENHTTNAARHLFLDPRKTVCARAQ